MVSEVVMGLGLFKTMLDSVKSLKATSDRAIRDRVTIELTEHILSAKEQQMALLDRIRDLEQELMAHEQWAAEKERYKLTDFGGGTFAYELKETHAEGEPPHRICANCYSKSHKSILQNDGMRNSGREAFNCPSCGTQFFFGQYRSRGAGPAGNWKTT